jgi:hypothetical protein
MKQLNYLIFLSGLLLGGLSFAQQEGQGQALNTRQFIINNNTGGTLTIRVAVDGNTKKTAEFELTNNEQRIIYFQHWVDTFQVGTSGGVSRQTFGFQAPNYASEIQKALYDRPPTDNVEATITKGKLFALPYNVAIEAVQGTVKIEQRISPTKKLIDIFPQVAEARRTNPNAPLDLFAILSSKSGDSFEEIFNNYRTHVESWQKAIQTATSPEEVQFAKNVIQILEDAYALILMENPLIRQRAEKAGIIQRTKEVAVTQHPISQLLMFPFTMWTGAEKREREARLNRLLNE